MSLSPTPTPASDRRRTGTTGPVRDTGRIIFVDSTGRRAVLLRRAGMVVGALFLAYGVLLAVSFMGGTSFAPSDLSPVGSSSAPQTPTPHPNSGNVRPGAGAIAAWRQMRLCRKACKNCVKQPGKPCRRKAFRNGVEGRTTPTPSARASVNGSRSR